MDRGKLIHRGELCKFQRIVLDSPAFDGGPSPSLAVGIGDKKRLVEFFAQIGQPSRCGAGFEYDHVRRMLFEELREFLTIRVERSKLGLAFNINAGDGLEFSKV